MMSNHVIGYGMNEVVETAVTMFEKSEISVNTCKKIINACLDSSCRYDRNKYETIEYLYEDYYGNCLKKIEKRKIKLYSGVGKFLVKLEKLL